MPKRFAARGSPLRQTGLVMLGVATTALCLWGTGIFAATPKAPRPDQLAFLWLAALFFGACTLVRAKALFDVREQIVVDDRGILSRQLSDKPIPWREIVRIEVRTVQRHRFLCLWLSRPEAYRSRRLGGWLAGLNQFTGFGGDVCIGTHGLDRSFDELMEAVEQHWPDAGG